MVFVVVGVVVVRLYRGCGSGEDEMVFVVRSLGCGSGDGGDVQ